MREECPNCGSLWSIDETYFNRCDCCGYPDHVEEEDQDDIDVLDEDENI